MGIYVFSILTHMQVDVVNNKSSKLLIVNGWQVFLLFPVCFGCNENDDTLVNHTDHNKSSNLVVTGARV
jgi:hypothetical protein